uniref:PQ-loop repeat-containing protein 3 n=1 Tax=Panthera tigris altaica TaxID=74533 RepID=A0A8C9M6X6_PANTA
MPLTYCSSSTGSTPDGRRDHPGGCSPAQGRPAWGQKRRLFSSWPAARTSVKLTCATISRDLAATTCTTPSSQSVPDARKAAGTVPSSVCKISPHPLTFPGANQQVQGFAHEPGLLGAGRASPPPCAGPAPAQSPPSRLPHSLSLSDVLLLLCAFHFNGNVKGAAPYMAVFVASWFVLPLQKWIIDLAMNLSTFISVASKFGQLQYLWKTRDSGTVSALTWSLAAYTCATRIITTIMTTGDLTILTRFVIMLALNVWVTTTVLRYRKTAVKAE